MQNNEFNEFDELIREIVQQEIQNYMKNEMIFRGITGQVIKVNEDGTCSVDIVTTILNNIENKSGSKLVVGDSVTLSERIGSDYSNCFINVKNGHQEQEEEEEDKTKDWNTDTITFISNIKLSSGQITGIERETVRVVTW